MSLLRVYKCVCESTVCICMCVSLLYVYICVHMSYCVIACVCVNLWCGWSKADCSDFWVWVERTLLSMAWPRLSGQVTASDSVSHLDPMENMGSWASLDSQKGIHSPPHDSEDHTAYGCSVHPVALGPSWLSLEPGQRARAQKRESWWGHYFLPDGLTFPNQGSALEDSCCDHKLREQKAGGLLCVT